MGDQGKSQEELIAERQAILDQLAELGDSSDDEEKEPEEPKEQSPSEPSTSIKPEPADSDEDGESSKSPPVENSRGPPVAFKKITVDRVDEDSAHPIPDGWTAITHESGMIVYFHKYSRVVTHSRPYSVDCAVRDHRIPTSAIPCLFRKIVDQKRKDIERRLSVKTEPSEEHPEEQGAPKTQNMKTEPSEEQNEQNATEKEPTCPYKENETMSPEEFREFCKGRFTFVERTMMRYPNIRERGEAQQERRANAMLKRSGFELEYAQLKKRNEPGEVVLSSASGSILIDMTPIETHRRNAPRKPFLLNPMGKTTVAVLNEFIQRLVKGSLVYEASDNRSVSHPYKSTAVLTMKRAALREMGNCRESLTVLCEIASQNEDRTAPGSNEEIAKFQIGKGVGGNKKTSRLAAAKDALSKLLPKIRVTDDFICEGLVDEEAKKDFDKESRELFKKLPIESSNLVNLCHKFAIPKPLTLLNNAVYKTLRWNGMELKEKERDVLPGGACFVVLELGDWEQKATGSGMKQALQTAAQLMFKKMHPELTTYGSLLELYGRLEDKERLDSAKKRHDEVVRLQDTGNLLRPNHIVLGKLVEEMKKVQKIVPPRQFLFGTVPSGPIGIRRRDFYCQFPMEIVAPPISVSGYGLAPPPFAPRAAGGSEGHGGGQEYSRGRGQPGSYGAGGHGQGHGGPQEYAQGHGGGHGQGHGTPRGHGGPHGGPHGIPCPAFGAHVIGTPGGHGQPRGHGEPHGQAHGQAHGQPRGHGDPHPASRIAEAHGGPRGTPGGHGGPHGTPRGEGHRPVPAYGAHVLGAAPRGHGGPQEYSPAAPGARGTPGGHGEPHPASRIAEAHGGPRGQPHGHRKRPAPEEQLPGAPSSSRYPNY